MRKVKTQKKELSFLLILRKNLVAGLVVLLTTFSIIMLRFSINPQALIKILLGIFGTFLIIQNEYTYTWRKKSIIKFGSLKTWIWLHMAAGIIGPALILWHADFNFSGFAGLVSYSMILVVISGIIGYFIYRFIPRTLKTKKQSLKDLTEEQAELDNEIRKIMSDKPKALEQILGFEILAPEGKGIMRFINAIFDYYGARQQIHRFISQLGGSHSAIYKKLEKVAIKRVVTERQVILLSNSERLLSNWSKVHRPITLTFFFAIGVHVITIIYYGRVI